MTSPPCTVHGFTDEDIWDIGAVAAFFGLSNRMANMTGMRPNDEFYTDGAGGEAEIETPPEGGVACHILKVGAGVTATREVLAAALRRGRTRSSA
jgi:hypothetical protein